MSFISRLKVRFGFIPETGKLESVKAALQQEFTDYVVFSESDELEHFRELEKFVLSPEFEQKKHAIMAQKFQDTQEFVKLQQYTNLKKSPKFKNYFKVKPSAELADFKATEGSNVLKEFLALDEYIKSDEYIQEQSNTDPKEFKHSATYQKFMNHKSLAKSAELKKYFKFKNSEKYRLFMDVEGSSELEEYQALETFVNSEEFKKVKDYMALPPKKKFEQSEEYKKQQEYLQLKASEKFKWFFALKDTHKFDEIKRWNITFEDNFEKKNIDTDKWITKYFYGESVLSDAYSLNSEQHFLTDGKNLEVSNDTLKIVTKREEVEGKAWDPRIGFFPKKWHYTSGIVNTGHAFRQQYGKIEAKVKLHAGANHAFWLAGEKVLPQINVFRFFKNKVDLGVASGTLSKNGVKKSQSRFPGGKYTKDFNIFTIEWTPEQIVWKINGLEAFTLAGSDVPANAMYLAISSGFYNGTVKEELLPAAMEVDWVRCYEKNSEFTN